MTHIASRAQGPAPQITPSPQRENAPRRSAADQARKSAPLLPDISHIPVDPENAPAAAWPTPIQRYGTGGSRDWSPHDEPSGVRSALRRGTAGGGAPLPSPTRTVMERAFGADFAAVRVHTGPGAQDVAAAMHARALTAGTDILFYSGAYRPGSYVGDRLVAHELAHVVQQTHGLPSAPPDSGYAGSAGRAAGLTIGHASLRAEYEADNAATLAVKGTPMPALSRQPVTVARQDLDAAIPSGTRQADFAGANAAMDANKWDEVALIVNGFSPHDLAQFLDPLKPWMLASIYAGAIATGLGPKSAVALATHVSYLDMNYENELHQRHWAEAAYYLNDFNEADIRKRLEARNDDEVSSLHAGAVQREDLGETSAAALVTGRVLAVRARNREVAKLREEGQLTLPTSTGTTAEPGKIGFIEIDARGEPGVDPSDREALDLGTDWSADPEYIDNNIVGAWYHILTSGSEFQVEYQDGSFIDLDLEKIRAVASSRPASPPPGPLVAAPAPGVTPPSPPPPPVVPHPPREPAGKPSERTPSGPPRRAAGYFRNRRNNRIYPDRFTAGSIPTIGWLADEIERKQPEARAGTIDALINVVVAAHGAGKGAISSSSAIERTTPTPRSKSSALDESEPPTNEPPGTRPPGNGPPGNEPPASGSPGGTKTPRPLSRRPPDRTASAQARAAREAAALKPPPLTREQEAIRDALRKQHKDLTVQVASEAAKGAVQGGAEEGGAGADVRLLSGGWREVTVHFGDLKSLGGHLQDKAMQARTTEIYLQINTPGATQQEVLSMIPELRTSYKELTGKIVRIFGPDGQQWWSGTFGSLSGRGI
jgi:hypothetical protein